MSCLRWDSGGTRTHDTLYSRQSALPTELPRQLSWLGPNLTSHSTPDEQANHQLSMKEKLPRQLSWLGQNLTSHSTPDEQANHQLSMKEKAGVMKPPMTPNTKPSIYMFLMRDEKEERKKQARSNKQGKATHVRISYSTPRRYVALNTQNDYCNPRCA